uniref:Amino acid permease/ SLC12A domain-containing protein n=1 Tax=Ciona savignyi TaxID=51511 RepID=H2YSC3_CIOSA
EVSLIGGISLIVGTMIGSGIFVSPKGVMRNAGSLGAGFLIWLGCGILATFGALSYAEVGTMIPKSGGEFPILLEAFGPIPAYLFAWTSTVVLKPSSLALLSLTFAKYALAPAYNLECSEPSGLAIKLAAVAVILTVIFINCASVKLSTKFLTVFSFGKVLSLVIIIIGGIVMLAKGNTKHFEDAFSGEAPGVREIALGFYQGLWAFDGWNQLNYVIEELKNPFVNLPRAVIGAMVLVTGLYMLTNVAYFTTMSMQELLESPAVAATFGDRVLGVMVWVIPCFVCWSVFGTCLGSCFTAGRISYVAAREGHFSKVLAMLHAKRMTPAPAVLLNVSFNEKLMRTCKVSKFPHLVGFYNILSFFILLSLATRNFCSLQSCMGFIAILMVIPNDFDTLIDYFSFSMWIFHGSTCAALLYFRYKLPDYPRPVKVPIVIPIIVCIAAVCLVMAPIIDDPKIHYLFAFMFIMSGLAFYFPFVH